MKNPIEFYISEKLFFEEKVIHLKRKLAVSSTVRLLVFLTTSLGVYFYSNNSKIMIPILIIGLISFIYLIFRHAILQDNKRLYVELTAINKKEIEVLNGNVTYKVHLVLIREIL